MARRRATPSAQPLPSLEPPSGPLARGAWAGRPWAQGAGLSWAGPWALLGRALLVRALLVRALLGRALGAEISLLFGLRYNVMHGKRAF